MSVFLNLTTAIAWRRHPVGVLRVERELAKSLRRIRGDVYFVRFNNNDNKFYKLTDMFVDEVLEDAWCHENTRGKEAINSIDIHSCSNKAVCEASASISESKKLVKRLLPTSIWLGLRKAKCRFYGWDYKTTYAQAIDSKYENFEHETVTANNVSRDPIEQLNGDLGEAVLGREDVYVSVGGDWDHTPINYVYDLKDRSGCKVILACYDLIPILYPEHTVRTELADFFKKHFIDMAHTSDAIFAISDKSKEDLLSFYSESKICRPAPYVESIPLAGMGKKEIEALDEVDAGMWQELQDSGNYVLYVSTIESRKNHKILFDVWSELSKEHDDLPTLVFVGMQGWGVSELIDQMHRSRVYKQGKIKVMTDISDALLSKMYSDCLFGVFPSLYEGWGLAATELMSYGKACICSNNSALGQASQYLVPLIHPLDFVSWKREISKLIYDEEYRKALEHKIATEYVDRSWMDFSKDFNGLIDDVLKND